MSLDSFFNHLKKIPAPEKDEFVTLVTPLLHPRVTPEAPCLKAATPVTLVTPEKSNPEKKTRVPTQGIEIKTVWRWEIETGESGTWICGSTTYSQVRDRIEQQLHSKVIHIEFVSAMAENRGFIHFDPETGEQAESPILH